MFQSTPLQKGQSAIDTKDNRAFEVRAHTEAHAQTCLEQCGHALRDVVRGQAFTVRVKIRVRVEG